MKNILIVTGGSGGHVIPSISIFEHLSGKFKVKIVTDLRGSRFIDKSKFNYELIDVPNLFLKTYLLPFNILKYLNIIFKSLIFLNKKNINIIISTGGYMTFPFCIAAFFLNKKIILLEPNSVLGRANKFALNFSSKIICYDLNLKNFPSKQNLKKIKLEPILKKEIYNIEKNKINFDENIIKVLILGGSQGAYFFDKTIVELILDLSKKLNLKIVQQISDKNVLSDLKKVYDKEKIEYEFFEFTNNSNDIFNGVNFAITRAGASTLTELSFLKIPFISIPLPTAKDNHQFFNANYYKKNNCCWIIDQNKFETKKVSKLIFEIFSNKENYKEKVNNLERITKKNTWNNVNKNIIEIINEN